MFETILFEKRFGLNGAGEENLPGSAGPKLHDMKQVLFGRFPCRMLPAFFTLSLYEVKNLRAHLPIPM